MPNDARRAAVRIAIAADLVLIAAAVAWLLAGTTFFVVPFVAAVAVAAWKTSWPGATVAIVLSAAALIAFNGLTATLVTFIVASLVAATIVRAAMARKREEVGVVDGSPANVVAMPVATDAEERNRESAARREMARSLERAAATQLSDHQKKPRPKQDA